MCVLIGVNQLGFGAIIPVLPLYAASYGVSQTAIGLTVAVYGVARLVTAIPAGRIADWYGRRSALAIGGLISAAGNLWCGYAGTFVELACARFVAGAGAGLTLTAGMIVLADITSASRRGRVMAIYQGVFLFAVGIGPFPGGYLAEHYGLEMPFLVYALCSLIAAIVGWFAVTETRPDTSDSRGSDSLLEPYARQLVGVLRSQGFRLAGAISFTGAVARTGALFSIVPLIGTTQLNLSATQIGLSMGIGSILGVLVTYPAGVLVDRFGRKSVIVPTTIVSGLAFLLYGLAPDFTWFIAASAVWGIASSASGAAPAAYAADIAPRRYAATAMSAYRTLADAGYVIGPIMLGVIADGLGMTTAIFVASGMLVGVAILFAVRAPESYRPD
jgi:MFS transporter, DHA1 family, multidrug resistance protein